MANPLMFLKEKPQAGVITEHRSEKEKTAGNPGLEAAAEDLMTALERKDTKGAAMALQSAFELCMSMDPSDGPVPLGDE